ncbi:uncharacterized protein RSE6_06962 [Rhynchosporium secalis]|uniref:Uncharacterized protein n=1 Tax=Rhynchosporium secalis TaxID=38038 RepID=A0A1E1MBV4_RHYSE|nr:uncharacterized protein RSE6_06962 [Rhynchosporium secalis]
MESSQHLCFEYNRVIKLPTLEGHFPDIQERRLGGLRSIYYNQVKLRGGHVIDAAVSARRVFPRQLLVSTSLYLLKPSVFLETYSMNQIFVQDENSTESVSSICPDTTNNSNRLWDELGKGDAVKIAVYAAEHFEKHKRPLRIAIDEAVWCYKYCIHDHEHIDQIRLVRQRDSQPSEKNILYQILKLLKLNIQFVFVADGPLRPVDKLKDAICEHQGWPDALSGSPSRSAGYHARSASSSSCKDLLYE